MARCLRLAALVALALGATAAAPWNETVKTTYGVVKGETIENVRASSAFPAWADAIVEVAFRRR